MYGGKMDSKNVLLRMQNIMNNLENAELDDIDQLLNYFNGESVMIEGVSTRPFNDPKIAAMLNARYTELTGEDHPNFLAQQPKVLDDLLSRESFYLRNDAYTPMQMDMFRRLRENLDRSGPGVEIIVNGKNHVLTRMDSIMQNLGEATLEDVDQLLNYFNGKSVLMDGTYTRPFNNPDMAARLNARYSEFTGQNHSNYMVQQPKVLANILKNEKLFIENGAYTESQIHSYRLMKQNIDNSPERKEAVFSSMKNLGTRFGITASKIIERRKIFDENCYKRYSTTRYTTSKCDAI